MSDVPKDKKVVLYRNIRLEILPRLEYHEYDLIISGVNSKTDEVLAINSYSIAAEELVGGDFILEIPDMVIGVVE